MNDLCNIMIKTDRMDDQRFSANKVTTKKLEKQQLTNKSFQ